MSAARRDFLKQLGAGAVLAGFTGRAVAATAPSPAGGTVRNPVQRRLLGRLGTEVSILGLGLGSSFTKPFEKDPQGARELLLRALEYGVNYWDTARPYGPSEELIGRVLPAVRDRVFMVSKSANRTYDGFLRDLELSLKSLRTDHLELYHLHNLDPKRDSDLVGIENGAVKAARRAREEGTIKAFGITGHSGAAILAECIRRFDPDAVLTTFPCNRPDDGRYEDDLLPLARERKLGVIAMKTVRFARETDLKGADLIRYALSLDGVHVAVVGVDTAAHLDENAAMAAAFTPLGKGRRSEMSRDARRALAGLTAPWDRPGYCDGQPV